MPPPDPNPRKRQTLSVAIIARNEEANLPRTLESIRWSDEIVVVDSGSKDATPEIARSFGARAFEEPWKGFAEQKNSAIAHCGGDWVLSLDADEEVTPELALEIRLLLEGEAPFSAYWIPRLNHFLGRPLRHGGYWPDPKLRLFRRGSARFDERPVHETLEVEGATGRLKSHLLHRCYPTLDEYIDHMNHYSTLGGAIAAAKGHDGRGLASFLVDVLLNPAATFIYNYFFRLGFLDGREGLLMHLNHSVYIHWKFVKAWQAGQNADKSGKAGTGRS
jgi:glycosyltransferase involved in cell wall biosynthesis